MLTTTKPHRNSRNWLIACFVLAAALATAVLGGAAQPAAADSPATAVLDWNKHALDALANAQVPPAPPRRRQGSSSAREMTAYVQGVHLAMVQGAVYDAVNSIVGGYEPYLDTVSPAPSGASESAAVATAARDTLIGILNQAVGAGALPGGVRDAIVMRLQGLHADALADADDGNVAQGVTAGQAAAAAMLARPLDGRTLRLVPVHVRGRSGRMATGRHDRLHDAALGAERRLRLGGEGDAVRRREQPAVPQQGTARAQHSGLYAKEYNEVKMLGSNGQHAHRRTAGARQLLPGEPGRDVQALLPGTRAGRGSRRRRAGTPLRRSWGSRTGTRSSPAGRDKAHWSNWRPQTAIRLGRRRTAIRRRTETRRLDVRYRDTAVSRPWRRVTTARPGVYMDDRRALLRAGPHDVHGAPPDRNDARIPALP